MREPRSPFLSGHAPCRPRPRGLSPLSPPFLSKPIPVATPSGFQSLPGMGWGTCPAALLPGTLSCPRPLSLAQAPGFLAPLLASAPHPALTPPFLSAGTPSSSAVSTRAPACSQDLSSSPSWASWPMSPRGPLLMWRRQVSATHWRAGLLGWEALTPGLFGHHHHGQWQREPEDEHAEGRASRKA